MPFEGEQQSYFLRARYYSPGDGRFLSQDPLMGSDCDPASLHHYLHASGDPVNRMDPGGREDFNSHPSKYRIVVEHSLAQMNQFQVLAQVFTPLLRPCEQGFRHDHERHSGLTRVVAGLVNRRVAQRPLKTYPTA